MSEKILNGRLVQKHDIEENWNKAINFVPKAGELIIYEDLNKIKIGNGVTTVTELPFIAGGGGGSTQISVQNHSLVISNGGGESLPDAESSEF